MRYLYQEDSQSSQEYSICVPHVISVIVKNYCFISSYITLKDTGVTARASHHDLLRHVPAEDSEVNTSIEDSLLHINFGGCKRYLY